MKEIQLHSILKSLVKEKKSNSILQKDVANDLKISESSLNQLISGKAKPSLDTLLRIRDYFDESLDFLVYGENNVTKSLIDDSMYRYIDITLTKLVEKLDLQKDSFYRITEVLIKNINASAKDVSENEKIAPGLINVDDIYSLEGFSNETRLITINLQDDLISVPGKEEVTAGKFIPIVISNIKSGRKYKFILPDIAAKNWKTTVSKFRSVLIKNGCDHSMIKSNIEIKTCKPNVFFSGCCIYNLDIERFEGNNVGLFERLRDSIIGSSLGLLLSCSSKLPGDIVMDKEYLDFAKKSFDNLWREGKKIL